MIDAGHLKALEDENRRLKHVVAQLSLEKRALRLFCTRGPLIGRSRPSGRRFWRTKAKRRRVPGVFGRAARECLEDPTGKGFARR